jgi:hypothetical protein
MLKVGFTACITSPFSLHVKAASECR